MVKLFCAIVGVTGSAFSVDVGEGQTVDDLKNAIKNARRNTLNHVGAGDLQLFLAKKKKGKGAWLTEAEVVKGVTDTTDFNPLKLARPILNQVGLSEKDVRAKPTLEDAKVGNTSVHVLVEISEIPSRIKQRVVGWKTEQTLLDMMKLGQGLSRATDLAEGTLLKTPSAFLGVNLRNGLYVRQEYWDVYSILNKELEDGETTRVLVLGSPGIGKSVFGVFLLLLFMSERKDVAYRPLQKRKELYYFTWDIEHNSYEVSLEPVSHRYYEGLFDGNDEGGAWYSAELVHSYLFASPGTNSYHAFAKDRCITIYMNPWTTEECKKYVDKVINPWRNIQPGSDTQNEWFMRYNIIGGKSRWLFSQTLKLKDFVDMVENAIPETFEDLKTVFRSIWAYRGYDGVENVLFALFRDENNPSRYVIDFASGIIDCKVSARFNSVSVGEFKRNRMTSNPLALAGRGHIRERLLLENAATSKMLVRPLEEESSVSAKLAGKLGPYKATSKMFQRVSEIVAEECLYRPVSKTFPSIDGVLVVPREKLVIYLQTTVSLRHSIQHKALKSAIEILVKKQGFADYTHIFLSLVDSTVETDTYDQFKKQRFKNVNNEDRQKVNNFEVVVRQYVGKMDNNEAGSAVSSPSSHNRLKRTRSEINGEEFDGSSSGGNTKQRGGTKNPKAPSFFDDN